MNHEEKVRLLEQANIECNEGDPRSRIIVQDNWAQIITPNAKGSASNAVNRSILSGFNNLLIHAKNHTAAPICRRLGFEAVYEHQVFSRELPEQ